MVPGRIVIMERGDCMFVDKARLIESAGALGGIVIGKSSAAQPVPCLMSEKSLQGLNTAVQILEHIIGSNEWF